MIAGIIIETWKKKTHIKVLKKHGFKVSKTVPGPISDTLILEVNYAPGQESAIKEATEKAQKACSN